MLARSDSETLRKDYNFSMLVGRVFLTLVSSFNFTTRQKTPAIVNKPHTMTRMMRRALNTHNEVSELA